MELTAAVKALDALKWPCAVQLMTDSEYLKKVFTEGWLAKWQRNGWRTAARQPVANVDLWAELARLAVIHNVSWRWVWGHADDELNNQCDFLAVQARAALAHALSKQRHV